MPTDCSPRVPQFRRRSQFPISSSPLSNLKAIRPSAVPISTEVSGRVAHSIIGRGEVRPSTGPSRGPAQHFLHPSNSDSRYSASSRQLSNSPQTTSSTAFSSPAPLGPIQTLGPFPNLASCSSECVTRTPVLPFNNSSTFPALSASKLAVGSSSERTEGSKDKAMARRARWDSPPESWDQGWAHVGVGRLKERPIWICGRGTRSSVNQVELANESQSRHPRDREILLSASPGPSSPARS